MDTSIIPGLVCFSISILAFRFGFGALWLIVVGGLLFPIGILTVSFLAAGDWAGVSGFILLIFLFLLSPMLLGIISIGAVIGTYLRQKQSLTVNDVDENDINTLKRPSAPITSSSPDTGTSRL